MKGKRLATAANEGGHLSADVDIVQEKDTLTRCK